MTLIFDESEQCDTGYKEIKMDTTTQFSFSTQIDVHNKVMGFSLNVTGSNPKIKVVE